MTAAELLKSHLETRKITYEAAGASLNVSRQTIWSWLTGASVPGEAAKRDIEEWSGGAVPAAEWPVVDRRRKPEEPAA